MFLRWAPGFNDSDLQANIIPFNNTAASLNQRQNQCEIDHDPLDSRRVDIVRNGVDASLPYTSPLPVPVPAGPVNPIPRSWRLVPLIYSAGRDGIYDIKTEMFDGGGGPLVRSGNPYYWMDASGNRYPSDVGAPDTSQANVSVTAMGEVNATLDHFDNIHNHQSLTEAK